MAYAKRSKRKAPKGKKKVTGNRRLSFAAAPRGRSKPALRRSNGGSGSGRAITIRVVQQAAAPVSPLQSLMMERLQKLVERKAPKASKF